MDTFNIKQVGQNNPERIILLNPLGASRRCWDPIALELIDRYEIITLDYPGYGSAKAMSFENIEQLAIQIGATLAPLLNEKPTHLIGNSFGSWVAQHMVAQEVIKATSLVLLAGSDKIYTQGKCLVESWLDVYDNVGFRYVAEQIALWSFTTRSFEENRLLACDFYYGMKLATNNNEVLKNQLKLVYQNDKAPDYSKIQIPTALIRGEEDFFFPHFSSLAVCKKIANAQLIEVPNTAHAVLIESPKQVKNHVYDFLHKQHLHAFQDA